MGRVTAIYLCRIYMIYVSLLHYSKLNVYISLNFGLIIQIKHRNFQKKNVLFFVLCVLNSGDHLKKLNITWLKKIKQNDFFFIKKKNVILMVF